MQMVCKEYWFHYSSMVYVLFESLLLSFIFVLVYLYSTAQRELDARTWVAGSVPEGDISTGMRVPAGIFPVSSKACL